MLKAVPFTSPIVNKLIMSMCWHQHALIDITPAYSKFLLKGNQTNEGLGHFGSIALEKDRCGNLSPNSSNGLGNVFPSQTLTSTLALIKDDLNSRSHALPLSYPRPKNPREKMLRRAELGSNQRLEICMSPPT